MVDSFSSQVRKDWNGANKVLAPDEQRLYGLYVGEVMDDRDPDRLGRVWVYIPGVSSRREDPNAYAGSANAQGGKFNPELLGWIRVSPTLPFGGNDGARVPVSPDGRSGALGTVNSYGQWNQVRKGDYVAVMFAGGDPNSGYMIGAVPHPVPSRTMPGFRGEDAAGIDKDSTGLVEKTNDKALLPVNDQKKSDDVDVGGSITTSSELARNIIQAGLATDPHRGVGTSSADRESPSYVTGIKTPGWNYESEKDNADVDGRPFREREAGLSDVNTSGHSFTMDDHPDFQSIRIRSSSGAQIFINDACTTPYVYIQSQTGNTWIEISDSGEVSIYASGSINMHAEEDFNLKVDGDFSCEVDGDYRLKIGGSTYIHSVGNHQLVSEGASIMVADEDMQIHSGRDLGIAVGENLDTRIGNNRSESIGGYLNMEIGSYSRITQGGSVQWTVDGEIAMFTTGNVGILSEGNMNVKIDGGFNLASGDDIFMDAPNIRLLEPVPEEPEKPPVAVPTNVIVQPDRMQLYPAPGRPGFDNIITGEIPDFIQSIVPKIPQHHPWGDRCGSNTTKGATGAISSRQFGDSGFGPYSYSRLCEGGVDDFVRDGATRTDSGAPEPVVGGTRAEPEGEIVMVRTPKPFESSRKGEKPKYDETVGVVRVDKTISMEDDPEFPETGYKLLKKWEGFTPQPILSQDGRNFLIGYGTRIRAGMEIGGVKVTKRTVESMSDNLTDARRNFIIDRDTAEELLRDEVNDIVDWMRGQFPKSSFSIPQFESLVSFVKSVGITRLGQDEAGRKWIEAVRSGKMDEAAQRMMEFSYVNGKLNCSILQRRREEIRRMSIDPDSLFLRPEANSMGAVDYSNVVKSPNGPAVPVDVIKAIKAAEKAYPKVPKYVMYQMAWQESAFRPDVPNLAGTSSAKGLYQFIDSTARQYGLDPHAPATAANSVWNPYANAMAAAAFMTDNIEKLEQVTGVTAQKAADIYILHFLGSGGGTRFLGLYYNSPGTIAADVFPKAARANRGVFYKRGGIPRTVGEVYSMFDRKFDRMIPYVKYLDERIV